MELVKTEERTAEELTFYLQDCHPVTYDELSENENDREEVEHEESDEQDVDEDTDFDPPGIDIEDGNVKEDDGVEPYEDNELNPLKIEVVYLEEVQGDQNQILQKSKRDHRQSFLKGKNNYRWSTTAPITPEQHSLRVNYLPSAKGEAKNVTTPLEAWSLLFSQTMLETIVQHTNEEIQRKIGDSSCQSYFGFTDLMELKAFLGLLYFGGVEKHNRTNMEDLWSPRYGYNLYRAVMTENRFKFLLACIRFDDKNTRAERRAEHGLAPIKDIWDAFIENCQKYYSPSSNCTIGKQLLGFRGRFSAKVCISNKPEKYGIKIVACNDAQTSYLISAEPYVGQEVNTGGNTEPRYYIKNLSEPIHHTERNITCDNWFMSVDIVQEMKEKYTLTMVGTLQKNKREIPTSFTSSAVAGTVRFAYADGNTLVSYWPKRNKVVLLLSSLHKTGRIDEETEKPEIITFYDATKGGTDTFEQLCKVYTTSRISKRWPLRLFYGMLDQAGVNALILHNLRAENHALNHRTFLKELAFSLVKPQLEGRLYVPTLHVQIKNLIREVLDLDERDFYVRGDKFDKLDKRKRCSFCTWKVDKKTKYCCASCTRPVCEDHRTHYCISCAM